MFMQKFCAEFDACLFFVICGLIIEIVLMKVYKAYTYVYNW